MKVKFALTIIAGALALSFAAGCKPSPEKVCGKMMDLLVKELGDKAKDSTKDMDDAKKKCIEESAKDKEKDPKKYECQSKCIMDASSFKDVESCSKKCGDDK